MADNGIYRSTNNGAAWTRAAEIVPRVTFIAFAIARNGSYFAGSSNGGVFRSTDNGVSWTNASEGLPLSFAWSAAANPLADEILIATGPGVYRTTNNGATWDTTGNNERTNNRHVPKYVAFTPDGTAYAALDSGIMRSTDALRATWTWTDSAIAPSPIRSLVVRHDTLWVGTEEHGVFRSLDDGVTWEARNTALESLAINALDAGRTDELFASTRDGGLYRSTDQGELWIRINPGSQEFVSASTHHAPSGRLFVASVKGLYYNDTHAVGTPWTPGRNGFINSVMRTMVFGPFGQLYAIQYTGVFHRTIDEGANWSSVDLEIPPNTDVRGMVQVQLGTLIVAVRGVGLYASEDNGETWSRFALTLPTTRPVAIEAVGGLNPKLYVTSDSGQVFASTDHGVTWTQPFTADSPTSLGALAVRDNVVIAASDQLFVRSTDRGLTWTALTFPKLYSLAFANDGTLYGGGGIGRVYKSTDLGETW
ncbi:MAG: hypothetical protein H7X80_08120, partial [bacterium]|nr:hypothetical protein [Candidatus Kapabacteria bacterium]